MVGDGSYLMMYWPPADWFDYSAIESQCDAVRERRVVVFMGDRLNRVSQLTQIFPMQIQVWP